MIDVFERKKKKWLTKGNNLVLGLEDWSLWTFFDSSLNHNFSACKQLKLEELSHSKEFRNKHKNKVKFAVEISFFTSNSCQKEFSHFLAEISISSGRKYQQLQAFTHEFW